jgi:predicted membrane-bound spermidine synthase
MKVKDVLLIAFIEGGITMLLEIISPLIISPVLGNSIYLWAVMISISVLALAIGYFLGGYFFSKKDASFSFKILLAAACSLFAGWALIKITNQTALPFNYEYISWFTVLLILFLPLILFGTINPILINIQNSNTINSSLLVGKLFSTSAFGGIVFSIVTGLFLVPAIGLSNTLLLALLLLLLVISYFYFRNRKNGKIIIVFWMLMMMLLLYTNINSIQKNINTTSFKTLHHSESIKGQLIVADINNKNANERILFINRMGQTWVNLQTNYSVWSYPNYITSIASMFPENTNSLLLGLGGGIVAEQLNSINKFNVDAVELDSRIIDLSKKYFGLKNYTVNTYEDDARRFIKKTTKKYDFVVFDIFNGEIIPSHVMSKNCFEDLKKNLSKKSLVVINFNGFIEGEYGAAGRALLKTIYEAGFQVKLFPTNENKEEDRNILYIAYLQEPDWNKISIHVNTNSGEYLIKEHFFDQNKINIRDAAIITDDKPLIELLNYKAAKRWRENYFLNFTLNYQKNHKLPLIK